MQRLRIRPLSVFRIAGVEPAGTWIVIPGAEVVKAEVGVELLAAVEEVVGRGAGLGEAVAVGVVQVLVRDYSGSIGQLPDTSTAVVAVEATVASRERGGKRTVFAPVLGMGFGNLLPNATKTGDETSVNY